MTRAYGQKFSITKQSWSNVDAHVSRYVSRPPSWQQEYTARMISLQREERGTGPSREPITMYSTVEGLKFRSSGSWTSSADADNRVIQRERARVAATTSSDWAT